MPEAPERFHPPADEAYDVTMNRKQGTRAGRLLAACCLVALSAAGGGAEELPYPFGPSAPATCPPGFSGRNCVFCTWFSAGPACYPGSPRDLFDLQAIKALTLGDLAWKATGTRHENGVTIVFGDWSGGVLATYDPTGVPVDVPLREAAALYVPDGYPATANPALGLVYAAHYPSSVDAPNAVVIARHFGMPVLYHGEYPNWRQAGYADRSAITQATGTHLMRENRCYPVDFVRGNFPHALARTDMRAITLLQRLVELRGGAVQKVALRGFSKEGAGAWLAFLVDDRIEVGIPGGAQGEDPITSNQFLEAINGCASGDPLQETVQAAVDSLQWRLGTPAGAAATNLLATAQNQGLLNPRVLLIDGDVGMYNMHDGSHGMPAGGESAFLDGLTARPWRYVRKPTLEQGADQDEGDVTSTVAVPILGAELLVAGPGSEATLYPDVLEATAALEGDSFVVTASATAAAQYARVWWTWSGDMVFTDVAQEPWASVAMTAAGDGRWSSPPITVPPGTVIAWYAEVGNSFTVEGTERFRRHAAPIRFLRPTAARHCEPTSAVYCEPTFPPRVRRRLPSAR